ncbi:DUF5825 family protein [Spirillospora sp. NPDC029432]|uniref:DUF5825 family protein n=1 Tax=Spirillospora sp. NPDC029432 TaxID=3154599 RepID=UPI003454B3D0
MSGIGETLELGGDPEATVEAVARLRDLAPTGRQVAWRGRVGGEIDLSLLHHLPPPVELEPGTAAAKGAKEVLEAMEAWARAYAFGSLHYRMGPGFLQVKDVRDAASPVQTVLEDPALIDAFTACLTPAAVRDVEAPALRDLVRRRLVLRVGDLAVTLPYRMGRWPVPFFAI